MGYDLDFWKYKKGVYLNNQKVYTKCSNDELVEGLENLETDVILREISKVFSGWETAESSSNYVHPNEEGAFQVFCTSQFVRFDCYGMEGEDMNSLIDVMLKHDCPLYDPQVSKRFDGK